MKRKVLDFFLALILSVLFWLVFIVGCPYVCERREDNSDSAFDFVERVEGELVVDEDLLFVETREQIVEEAPKTKRLGVFKLTAYCTENYPHICNNGDATRTATGTTPIAGKTIAVDPSVIPYGTKVIIDGHTYVAEDCGGAIKGNRIDVVFDTHKEALEFGVQHKNVEVVLND